MVSKTNKQLQEKIKKKQQRKELLQALLPLLKSFGLWIVLVAVIAYDYAYHQWFSMVFIDWTVQTSYWLAKIVGLPARLLGEGLGEVTTLYVKYKSISINRFPMLIELECSAYHAYMAMFALVFFSAWKWKRKIYNGAIIFLIMTLVNAARIVVLGVIGRTNPGAFNAMHDYVWNILLIIVIWGLWELMNRIEQKRLLKFEAQNSKETEEISTEIETSQK